MTIVRLWADRSQFKMALGKLYVDRVEAATWFTTCRWLADENSLAAHAARHLRSRK